MLVLPAIRCVPHGATPRRRFVSSNTTRVQSSRRDSPKREYLDRPIDEGPTTGGRLSGLAVPFSVRVPARRIAGQPGEYPLIFHRGCFAEQISRVHHDIRLCLGHDRGIVIADSGNCFYSETERGLEFVVWCETSTDSRRATMGVCAGDYREVSISGEVIDAPLRNGVRHIHRFKLHEVSLTKAGAAPGTFVRYLSASEVEQERRERLRR